MAPEQFLTSPKIGFYLIVIMGSVVPNLGYVAHRYAQQQQIQPQQPQQKQQQQQSVPYTKPSHVAHHPLESLVQLNPVPIMFYGENGRVHWEYRPILPKVLYTVSVLGELMRGVGATVNDVLHRASVGFPRPYYGTPQYPHPYYYSQPKTKHSTTNTHQQQQLPEYYRQLQRYQASNQHQSSLTPTYSPGNVPLPVQISLSSQLTNKYAHPPVTPATNNRLLLARYDTAIPRQNNIVSLISKAISGA